MLAQEMHPICKDVTHAYFSSYVHKDDFAQLNTANASLFENFLTALLDSAHGLQNCTLQTGGKYYNVHLQPVPSPVREEDIPSGRYDADAHARNFYYAQEDFLARKQRESASASASASQPRNWTWNVIRPEAIIGSTSKPNGMNEALTLALYFLTCKELGVAEAVMPTNWAYWNGTDDVSDARLIADISVWASTSACCANEAFNVANGDYFTWRYMWPRLAAYFGARASSEQGFARKSDEFRPGENVLEVRLEEWARDKQGVWERLCERAGVPGAKDTFRAGTWAFQDWVFSRTWSATLSVNKARRFDRELMLICGGDGVISRWTELATALHFASMPASRSTSIARWLKICARGVLAVDLWREITTDRTPSRPSSRASVAPEGPAPMMRTGVSISFNKCDVDNDKSVSCMALCYRQHPILVHKLCMKPPSVRLSGSTVRLPWGPLLMPPYPRWISRSNTILC